MILKKIVIGIFLGCFLNGCVGGSAMLGPAYTLANSGSVYHAGLSYGSSKVVNKIIIKTPTENIKSTVSNKKTIIEEKEENYGEFFVLVKSQIEKKSKILNLANQ